MVERWDEGLRRSERVRDYEDGSFRSGDTHGFAVAIHTFLFQSHEFISLFTLFMCIKEKAERVNEPP